MSKQNFEIRRFNLGIMANPDDQADIPDDAATYSKNIDPLEDGVLAGIPSDKVLKVSGFNSNTSQFSFTAGGAIAGNGGQAPNTQGNEAG